MATYRYVWSVSSIITEEELVWAQSSNKYIAAMHTSTSSNIYYWNGSTDYDNSQNWVFSGNTIAWNGGPRTATIPAGKIFLISAGIITGIRPSHRADSTLTVGLEDSGGTMNIVATSGSFSTGWYNNVQKPGPAYDYVASNYSASYPNDGISGSYWYKYLGMENIDATSISYPTSIRGGDQIQLAFTINGLYYADKESIKIRYQLAFDGTYGEVIDITVNNNNRLYYQTVIIPVGTNTFQAKFSVSDTNNGIVSNVVKEGPLVTVINNTSPTISGQDGDLGTFTNTNAPDIKFTITDAEESNINYDITLNNQSIMSGQAVSGTEYTVTFPNWIGLTFNTYTLVINADDGQGGTATRTYTFTKVNSTPNISGEDSDLGTFRYEYPTISYIITDPDEQTVIRKIELDSAIVAAEEAIVLGQEYTYTVTEEQMGTLADGVHTIKITATDSEGASAIRQYTFTKFFGSDTLYQRLRRLNDLGLYDTIYFENIASNIIRPNGMTVQETIDKIEADLAELEK